MMVLKDFFPSFEQQAATDDVLLIEAWLIMEGPYITSCTKKQHLFKSLICRNSTFWLLHLCTYLRLYSTIYCISLTMDGSTFCINQVKIVSQLWMKKYQISKKKLMKIFFYRLFAISTWFWASKNRTRLRLCDKLAKLVVASDAQRIFLIISFLLVSKC